MNDFENELRKRPMRQIPAGWREQILGAARPQVEERRWWPDLLWPSPKAWGALATAWILIICFNLATGENGGSAAPTAEAAQLRMATEQKRHLQAEMEEASLHLENESPKPRSEGIVGGKAV